MAAVIKARNSSFRNIEPFIFRDTNESLAKTPGPETNQSQRPRPTVTSVVDDAEAIIETAKLMAEKIVAKEVESARTQGYEDGLTSGRENGFHEGYDNGYSKGYEEGYAKGLTDSENEYKAILCSISEFAQQLRAPTDPLDEYTTQDIIKLAIAIASRIVKTEIYTNPECLMENIVDSLKRTRGVDSATIRVHPDDVEHVDRITSDLSGILGINTISVIPDSSVEQGGCFVETKMGSCDARLSTQLLEISRELLSDFSSHPSIAEICDEA